MSILIIYLGLVGLCVGSFLNVVIYRVPNHLSIIRPRSACPRCHTPIESRDNIPVISWLILRAKCRTCHQSIAWRYPAVELLTALAWSFSAARIGEHLVLIAVILVVSGLIALALIDFDHLLLPRSLVYVVSAATLAALVAAALQTQDLHRLVVALLSGAVWFIVFFALNIISPRHLGFGDVRLSALLGLILGWWGVGEVLLGFFLSNLVGAVIGVVLLATKVRRRDQPLPYGVFLAIGTVVTLWCGPALLAHWHHWPNG